MTTAFAATGGFDFDLKAILPRLRIYAMSLTRDGDRADDLVQQTTLKALAGRQSFRPGTNFAGWMFRIERNEFISGLRRARPTVNIDALESTDLSTRPCQEDGLGMGEFMTAFRRLPKSRRQALLLAQVAGYSHEEIARHAGVAIGTVKSRISRGRTMLAHFLR
jgi:RNA polymerase sigma-70 factor (ECF subfamily)